MFNSKMENWGAEKELSAMGVEMPPRIRIAGAYVQYNVTDPKVRQKQYTRVVPVEKKDGVWLLEEAVKEAQVRLDKLGTELWGVFWERVRTDLKYNCNLPHDSKIKNYDTYIKKTNSHRTRVGITVKVDGKCYKRVIAYGRKYTKRQAEELLMIEFVTSWREDMDFLIHKGIIKASVANRYASLAGLDVRW